MATGTTEGTTAGAAEGGTICTGCGTPGCPGCGRAFDPPRFCPRCGRRLTVAVTPAGYRARCRDHGPLTV